MGIMEKQLIPYQIIDWAKAAHSEHAGQTGSATWETVQFPGLRLRIVEYGPGYLADHWCRKGHIVHCLEGAFESELDSGEKATLTKGMTYIASDEVSSHRSSTVSGCRLLIIDGAFLGA
jgi:quercetin dioxygenase-like cupin family protein